VLKCKFLVWKYLARKKSNFLQSFGILEKNENIPAIKTNHFPVPQNSLDYPYKTTYEQRENTQMKKIERKNIKNL
jgi:hypothetical protein